MLPLNCPAAAYFSKKAYNNFKRLKKGIMLKKLFWVNGYIGMLSLLLILMVACEKEPTLPYRISLGEASEIVADKLPIPSYLPKEYEIKAIYLTEKQENIVELQIFISDKNISAGTEQDISTVPKDIVMQITLHKIGAIGGLKIVGEWFQFDNIRAVLVTEDNAENVLWWILPYAEPPGQYKIALAAKKEIPTEELIKIASSVTRH